MNHLLQSYNFVIDFLTLVFIILLVISIVQRKKYVILIAVIILVLRFPVLGLLWRTGDVFIVMNTAVVSMVVIDITFLLLILLTKSKHRSNLRKGHILDADITNVRKDGTE